MTERFGSTEPSRVHGLRIYQITTMRREFNDETVLPCQEWGGEDLDFVASSKRKVFLIGSLLASEIQ